MFCRTLLPKKRFDPIQGKRRQVSRLDVDNAFEEVRKIGIPQEHKVLHIIPQRYLIDKQGEYEDPAGATGARLTIQAHTLVCPATAINNHSAICNQLGIKVARLIFEPLAAAEAVLTQDERDRGVLLVDMGHETTQTLLIRKSSIMHTFIQPYGARHVTSDLVEVLGVGQLEADRVKREVPLEFKGEGDEMEEGVELHQAVTETKKIVRKKMISEVMGARIEEIAAHRRGTVITICRTGSRSARAAAILHDAGFANVLNMTGGTAAWRERGFPFER